MPTLCIHKEFGLKAKFMNIWSWGTAYHELAANILERARGRGRGTFLLEVDIQLITGYLVRVTSVGTCQWEPGTLVVVVLKTSHHVIYFS